MIKENQTGHRVPVVSDAIVKHKVVTKEQIAKDKPNILLQKDLLLLAMSATTLYFKARLALKESK